MIPSVLTQHVRRGIEDFLRTSFPISTHLFHGLIDDLLDAPGEVFKGPFLSIQLPFLQGEGGADFFPDVPLGFPPWKHQEQAFRRLGGTKPRSTLVATGTGSGKTECFLYPILSHCYKNRDQTGLKAILVYPMNALASDQAMRIARTIWDNDKLKGNVTAGLFVGQSEKNPLKVMTRDGIITSKETLRLSPPDILLTNYKMLDYLLVRPKDYPLWKHNGPETLRYLVVDELHTFDGAQGTDLACLIRRLKARLNTPENYLCCVGTSATMGDETGQDSLVDYARTVFDEEFDQDAVITEARKTAGDFLFDSLISRLEVVSADATEALDPSGYDDYSAYVRAQHGLWFDRPISEAEFGENAWRFELAEHLKGHYFFQNLLKVLGGKPRTFAEVFEEIQGRTHGFKEADSTLRENLLVSLLSLVSEARVQIETVDGQTRAAPFLNVRLQLWLRELRRMVCEVSSQPRLRFADDLTEEQQASFLPLVHCRECGAMGWAGMKRQHEDRVNPDLQAFYVGHFGSPPSPNVIYLFPDSADKPPPGVDGNLQRLCPGCLYLYPHGQKSCTSCGNTVLIDVLVPDSRVKRGKRFISLNRCPYCGARDGLTVLGSRAASLISVLITQLFSSTYNDDKKLLAFSDSVQDAAYRAGFFGARTFRFNSRAALQQFVQAEGDGLNLEELPKRFCRFWGDRLGELNFVTTFLPPDMAWLEDVDYLHAKGKLRKDGDLRSLIERRIGWEVLSEYGFRARIGRTLEKTSSSVAHVDPALLDGAVERLLTPVRNEFGSLRKLPAEDLRRFLLGMLVHLKDEGGVMHPGWDSYIERRGNTYLISKHIHWMPNFGYRSRTPAFLSSSYIERFDRLLSNSPTHRTWHQAWAEKCFVVQHAMIASDTDSLYPMVIKSLIAEGILEERSVGRDMVWGIRPKALVVSGEVSQLRCSECDHNASVATSELDQWTGARCLRFHCHGSYKPVEAREDYYRKLYASGDIERLIPAEHTGLLEREEREELERQFKAQKETRKPWYPNMLSCTPTLEMGIDIGDLSSLALCSVPPNQASYLQRIGRAGRRDGNSLSLTVANGRPHDLFFYAEPEEMIAGQVEPPGVFLQASAVLERQLAAWCFDRWVETGVPANAVPDRLTTVLNHLEPPDPTWFPHDLLQFIELNRTELLGGFLARFELPEDSPVSVHLKTYIAGGRDNKGSLAWRMLDGLRRLLKERSGLKTKIKLLRERIKAKEKETARSKNHADELRDLVREKGALQALSRSISNRNVFNHFTDEGVLPNYAFPEAGVTLRSVIYRKREKAKEGERSYQTWSYDYERPAAAGLSELAPDNKFYAGGRGVKVDQIDLGQSPIEIWRLCPECSYAELEGKKEKQKTCPRCSDPQWADEGQRHPMLRLRQVLANTADRDSRITDDSDDREPNFYNRQMLVDFEAEHFTKAFKLDSEDLPFGFEFLSRCNFREINFGKKGDLGSDVKVAGLEFPRNGFLICRHCGKVQDDRSRRDDQPKIQHAFTCTARNQDSEANLIECIYLYRELDSEAIRILLPVTTFAGSDRMLHSFVAAMHLGLKRRFQGNIDHLQTALYEEPVPNSTLRRQYLVLYDTVPGGTGYLKQLMQSPDELMEVIESALEVLTTCTCTQDPDKDGCYRCLFAYRHSYDMKETSRQTAVELLSDIARRRDRLVETDSLSTISMDAIYDSVLEAKFIEALRLVKVDGQPAVMTKELVNGNPGFHYRLGGRAWTIECQVPLGESQCVSVPCKTDFVIRPARARDGGKPIAVFTDGYHFHKDRIGQDMAQRMALLRSGRFLVWSLTWHDVESAFTKVDPHAKHFQNYLDTGSTPMGHQFGPFAEAYGAGGLQAANGESSFDWLVRFLKGPDPNLWRAYAAVHGQMFIEGQKYAVEKEWEKWVVGVNEVFPGDMAPLLTQKRGEGLLGLCEKHGKGKDKLLRLFVSMSKEAVASKDPTGLRVGCQLEDDPAAQQHGDFVSIWTGFLRLYNLFQFLPNVFFVTKTGLAEQIYDAITAEGDPHLDEHLRQADEGAWREVQEETDPELHPLLWTLLGQGWTPPEVPPFEFTDEVGTTIAEAELGWPELRIAVLDEPQLEYRDVFEQAGWRALALSEVIQDPADLLAARKRGGTR